MTDSTPTPVDDQAAAANIDAPRQGAWVDLESFRVPNYQPAGKLRRALWYLASLMLFDTSWPVPSGVKCRVLRWFGAQIGRGVVIKPNVRIKFPWLLKVGDFVWIGEEAWIDNMAEVRIGSHVCISQGVYFCTGSHDHRKRTFDLITGEIVVEDGAWVTARCTLLGGVTVGENALVTAGSMVHRNVPARMIVGGNPAKVIRDRQPVR